MRKASGSLYGLAYGDSLGKPTEFMPYEEIVAAYGPGGPRELSGDPALVTDDTQMMLAVGFSLLSPLADLEPVLRKAFVEWSVSPDNNRAPGMTCLRACASLAEGRRWQEASQIDSKGCGANMRVTPLGVAPGLTEDDRAGGAQLQAGLTHGHPTALAASELTALGVRWLMDGLDPEDLVPAMRDRCASQRTVYRSEWLGDLWQHSQAPSVEAFIARGWDETDAALARVSAAVSRGSFAGDPCHATGAGWIAEEALATALYCYLISPEDPLAVVGRGACSSGDSDSIACLAGAFAGAALGMAAWPSSWASRIEYADRLHALGTAWDDPAA
ncbi:ADP-ribosylglycohydrolase family protein [Actinoplanes sp. RD1]|uniref:ADP-ribosylglycohydrolase family protein n=1 Tax=Actinoplanes sp. RD1 TaxID=3064538 RepID=UPI002741FF65|nr:ADP-ribosylglycohydrolase family protein [Actinoplanes sp. RD1]